MNCDPSFLANAARCFSHCIPLGGLASTKTYLLCRIAAHGLSGGGGGGGTTPPTPSMVIDNNQGGPNSIITFVAPTSFTSTEIWVSTDNIDYVLIATVAAPGATTTTPSRSNTFYAKIRWVTGATTSNFSLPANVVHSTSWSNRTVTNGGAAPTVAAITAATGFFDDILAGNLGILYYGVCMPSDSIAQSFTPLIYRIGNSLWTNTNFVLADLTVNGLVGDGTKHADTGISPAAIRANVSFPDPTASFGLDFLNFTDTIANTSEIGARDGGTYNTAFVIYCHFGDNIYYSDLCFDGGAGRVQSAMGGAVLPALVFLSNRRPSDAGLTGWTWAQTGGLNLRAGPGGAIGAVAVTAANLWAWGQDGAAFDSTKRGSFVGIRQGAEYPDVNYFAGAYQNARLAYGGGATA